MASNTSPLKTNLNILKLSATKYVWHKVGSLECRQSLHSMKHYRMPQFLSCCQFTNFHYFLLIIHVFLIFFNWSLPSSLWTQSSDNRQIQTMLSFSKLLYQYLQWRSPILILNLSKESCPYLKIRMCAHICTY